MQKKPGQLPFLEQLKQQPVYPQMTAAWNQSATQSSMAPLYDYSLYRSNYEMMSQFPNYFGSASPGQYAQAFQPSYLVKSETEGAQPPEQAQPAESPDQAFRAFYDPPKDAAAAFYNPHMAQYASLGDMGVTTALNNGLTQALPQALTQQLTQPLAHHSLASS